MEIKKIHWIGIGAAIFIIGISFIFINTRFFFFIIGFGVLLGITPFVLTIISENKAASEKEEMFLEFARNLVESVKTGTPISKSIINMRNKQFGVLSQNVAKLANQISMGIPLSAALQVFARDLNNKTISRALTLIAQAEKAGGNIGEILEAVAKAVNMIEKLQKERKSTISTLVAQGYIIFFVFMIIILVMQFYIIPMISGISNVGGLGVEGISTSAGEIGATEISNAFMYLLLIQGLFSGLAIGKLSEGNIKAGIKHSFALMILSFLVSAVANIFFAK